MFGVVSEDCQKNSFKSSVGITVLDWMTEAEAVALKEDGDPIDAPPGPYCFHSCNNPYISSGGPEATQRRGLGEKREIFKKTP